MSDLPGELRAAIERKSQGALGLDAADRASSQSKNYRSGGTSAAIRTERDALIYAIARMPATYAAVAATLRAIREASPDFVPDTLLDIGAGPGTVWWAARAEWEMLQHATLIDSNLAFRALALDLAGGISSRPEYRLGEALTLAGQAENADLVVASYVIGELTARDATSLIDALWSKTAHILLLVEPGTPDGYRHILDARASLIEKGAHILAPCPHANVCPLKEPDWCHFSQRLPRSRAHKHLKRADLGYEDERYIYLAASRVAAAQPYRRVLAPPAVTKADVTAKLCTADGLAFEKIARRSGAPYASAKKWRWGDAVDSSSTETADTTPS